MSELFTCIGLSFALLYVCIVGWSFMLCNKIIGVTQEIRKLRMDLKQKEQEDE